jgi:hypothetical protein
VNVNLPLPSELRMPHEATPRTGHGPKSGAGSKVGTVRSGSLVGVKETSAESIARAPDKPCTSLQQLYIDLIIRSLCRNLKGKD